MTIPIIDIFAGPGGLGEGFSSVVDKKGKRIFKIALSVEMEKFAHQTLTLRSFYRQFLYKKGGQPPEDYYKYLAGEITREKLFELHDKEAKAAAQEAVNATLGDEENFPHDAYFDEKISNALGRTKNWVLIGGPPCQAYSLVGRARRTGGGGTEEEILDKLTEFEKDPKHTLYKQYLRIIARHSPSVFIMENVKGILSAKHKDSYIFPQILNDLHNPKSAIKKEWDGEEYHSEEYEVFSLVVPERKNDKSFIIRSENYGVPQARHRVILLGIRKDFYVKCKDLRTVLTCQEKTIGVHQAIKDLPPLRSGLSKTKDGPEEWQRTIKRIPKQDWFRELPENLRSVLLNVVSNAENYNSRGSNNLSCTELAPFNNWFKDSRLRNACNHETRSHIVEDIFRYAFVSSFGKVNEVSPRLVNFPEKLLPKHKNVDEGVKKAKFADRFRVQIGTNPSTTITCHISKDGHYFIHPDPNQVRSLTVREAARLQTFPDNYFFEGPRTAQYHQVGNAVPPFLAYQIGQVVAKLFGKQITENG